MEPLYDDSDWEYGPGENDDNVGRFSFEGDCHYRSADANMGRLVRDLRRQERSDLRNRILSIHMDSQFVAELVGYYRRAGGCYPVFANLRNGLWYGMVWDGACYFKSTDGHSRRWSFSYTRLNLHLVAAAATAGGCIVIDSTRNGKRFPDSFTATVPIWCCVLNRIAEPKDLGGQIWDTAFHAPRWLSASEASQIEQLIPGWIRGLGEARSALSKRLRKVLKKPLRPVWLSPESRLVEGMLPACPPGELSFTPVICVSASKVVTPQQHREHHSWSYIQGAGDDEEHWAYGLTPEKFWEHSERLVGLANGGERVTFETLLEKLRTKSETEVSRASDTINEAVRHGRERWCSSDWHPGGPKIYAVLGDTGLAVGSVAFAAESWACVGDKWSLLNLSDQTFPLDVIRFFTRHGRRYLHIPLKSGKRANPPRYWKINVFPSALEFIAEAVGGVQYRGCRGRQTTAIDDGSAAPLCSASWPAISCPEDAAKALGRKNIKAEGEGLSGSAEIVNPGDVSEGIPEYAMSGDDPGMPPLVSKGTVARRGIRIFGDSKGLVEAESGTIFGDSKGLVEAESGTSFGDSKGLVETESGSRISGDSKGLVEAESGSRISGDSHVTEPLSTHCVETSGARAGGCLVVCPTGSEASVIVCLAALIAFYPSRRPGNQFLSPKAAEVLDASPDNRKGIDTVDTVDCVDCADDYGDLEDHYLGGAKGGFSVLEREGANAVTKADVRWRFLLLQQECPWARPPRRLMQELNEYFMTPGDHSWWTLSDRLLMPEVKPS